MPVLECIQCESQEEVYEPIRVELLEKVGWDDEGDGPICPDCIARELQRFIDGKEIPIYAYEKTDHFAKTPEAQLLAAIFPTLVTEGSLDSRFAIEDID